MLKELPLFPPEEVFMNAHVVEIYKGYIGKCHYSLW